MGRPELASDPRYVDHVSRGAHQKELDEIVEAWTTTLPTAEVERLMIAHSVPSGTIYRAPEMLEDPHFAARDAIVTLDHPRWGELKMQASFPKMSATPGSIRSIAPQRVGQHNEEVYGALGLSADDRAVLAAAGAI